MRASRSAARQSFFDNVTFTNRYNYLDVRTAGDAAADGTNLAAYTRELGDGFSVNISGGRAGLAFQVGHRRRSGGRFRAPTASTATDNHGIRMPDFIGSLRVNQAWGHGRHQRRHS